MALSHEDKLSRVWVYLDNATRKAYNEGDIDDNQLIELGVKQGWIPADFSEVEGSASTVPVGVPYAQRVAERSAPMREDLGSLLDSLQSGVQASGSGIITALGDLVQQGTPGLTINPFQPQADILSQESLAAGQRAEEVLASRDGGDWLALRTGQDIARSLPSIASILNPATLAPAAGAYIFGQEYGSGRQAGLTPGEALGRAVPMTAAEYAFERLPVGQAAGNLFPVLDDILKVPARVAATAGAEAVTEGLTTQAQLGIDAILARTSEDKEVREFAQSNLPKDIAAWWDETSRSMLAGGGMGAAIGGPMQAIQVSAERGKLAADLLSTLDSQQDNDALTRFINQDGRYGVDPFQEAMDQELEAIGSTVEEDALIDPFENDPMANEFDAELLAESNAALAPTEPTPAPVVEAAPVAPVKPPRKRKTVTQKKAEIKSTEQTLDDLIKQITPTKLAQDYEVPGSERVAPTGTQVADVGNAIVEKLGRGNAQVAARLLVNGNIRLVQSESDIPTLDQAKKTSTAGYYDGNQAYVVADHLDPNNIVGEMLSVAAHELKHATDLSVDPTIRTTLGEFVGEVANEKINRQIEALAEEGNPLAIQAVSSAQGPDYELELPAYFINESRNERAAAPAAGRVLGNIVSAVRTTAKRVVPGDYDVNLDDVAYLSDQLLKTTAVENPNLAQQGRDDAPNFLQMIVGKKATSFDEQERKGLVYKSRDGNLKTWMSDADSRLKPSVAVITEENQQKLAKQAGIRRDLYEPRDTLENFLDHDVLFREYPQLREMTVTVVPMKDNALGSYNRHIKDIKLNSNLFDGSVDFNNKVHRILMHEIQHAVQDIEGFDSGTSPETVLSVNPKYFENQGLINTATANIANIGLKVAQRDAEALADELGLRTAVQHEELASALVASNRALNGKQTKIPLSQQSYTLGQELIARLRNRPLAYSDRIVTLANTLEDVAAAKIENLALEDEAFTKYQAKLGEQEARYTEQNIDMTEDWMEMQPGASSINPEVNFPETWQGENPPATSLSMAINVIPHSEKIGNDPKAMNKVWRTLKRMLAPSGGFPPELNEIRLHGSSLPAALAVHSTQLGDNFLTAIQENANRLKIDETQLREKLGKRIDKIDSLDNMDMRVTAVAALDREYPGVGKALNDLREYKLNLTREIIALRKRDPKPLSKKEIAIYKKMIQNAERYTTRAYLATYNQELGQLYGKHLLQQFKVDPDSEEGKIVKAALEYLANNELVIPPEEGLAAMKSQDLRRLHKAWIGSTGRYKGKKGRAAMIANLTNLPPRTKEMVDKKSMEIVRDLLGLNQSKSSKLFHSPSMRQQRTIIEARTDLPEPLRKLMGEITDPVLRETISLQRMINLTTKTKVLTELYEKGAEAGWWSDTRTDAHQRELSNVAYGPLDGKWINQDVEDAITGTILSMENLDSSLAELMEKPDALMQVMLGASFKPSRMIMSLQKTTQVVMSPINMLMNFGGALLMMAPSQGLINPTKYWKGMYNTAQVLGREISTAYGTPQKNEAAAELLMAGVTDSATMGEFRGEQFHVIHQEIKKMIDNKSYSLPKVIQTVFSTLKETPNALRQGYAFMDVWVKAATYYQRKDFLTEFNKVENKGWSEEDIIRRAGYEAAGTNISYERSIPLVRALEQNVPFFMFLTYFSETFRATAMSYAQAYKDFNMAAKATTPEGRNMAMKIGTSRLVGTTAMTVGVQQAIMHLLDNEDEEEKKKRLLDADYMEDKLIFPMGINDDRNEVMVELQRLDPIGPMNEFIIKLRRAPEGELAATAAQGVYDMFVESRGVISAAKLLTDMAVHSAASVNPAAMEFDRRRKTNTVLERNYPKTYEWIRSSFEAGDIGENMVTVLEEVLLPTAIEPFVDAERTQVSETREGDVTINGEPIHPLLRAAGYKAYVRDPHMSLTFRTMDYNDAITRLRKEAADLNSRAAVMDPADLLEGLNSIRSQEQALFDDMHNAYEGFMAFDNTKVKEFNDIVGNKTLAADLRRGRFQSRLVDSDALKRWYDRAKKERGADKAALNEEYQLLKRLYGESRRATE